MKKRHSSLAAIVKRLPINHLEPYPWILNLQELRDLGRDQSTSGSVSGPAARDGKVCRSDQPVLAAIKWMVVGRSEVLSMALWKEGDIIEGTSSHLCA